MADEIKDLLQVRIEKAKSELPIETSNAIAAVDWRSAIIGMRVKKGYTFEQLGTLELETELLLCGLTSPENYPKELESRMKISGAEANELVNEMNNTVFRKIREELIKSVERKKIFAGKKGMEPEGDFRPAAAPINIAEEKNNAQVLKSAGIEIVDKKESSAIIPALTELPSREDMLKKIERPELIAKTEPVRPVERGAAATPAAPAADDGKVHPLIEQKFAGTFGIPMVQTEYSLNNISKTSEDLPASVKPGLPASIVAKIKPAPADEETKTSKSYRVKGDPYRLSPDE